jgi:hypothetical protein
VQYVEGVVTLDGKPVEGATVSFSAADNKGSGAVGITDASGIYKLTALPDGAAGAGAVTGDYLVTISKVTVSDPNSVTSSDDPNYGKFSATKSEPPKSVKVIPEKYENTATSGFKATVKPGQNKGDEFNFDCKSS